MTAFAELILSRARLFVSVALLLSAVGGYSWLTMPRQEDPTIPARASLIVVPFPGASAEAVERLVLDPLEDQLARIDDVREIHSTARANVAVVIVETRDSVSEVDPVWDEVERRLQDARHDFPAAVGEPTYDRDIFDQESVLVAISGGAPLDLRAAARRLEDRLLALPEVSRTVMSGNPGEQVRVAVDEGAAARLGVDLRALGAALGARNASTPAGGVAAGGRLITILANTEFESVESLESTPITLPSGSTVRLGDIARVTREPESPRGELARVDGRAAVVVGVVPRARIDLLVFGETVSAAIAEAAAEHPSLRFELVAYQPVRVEARLKTLGRSLASGVLIVALVLIVAMGPRLGLTVASIVPLVAMAALAVYAMGGGVLHQMSIAALVLALGLLVDNAIVVAEHVQSRLDAGAPRIEAARSAIAELALPLGSATGTTLAAFVPMLLAVGPTGDFTRALPIVIMLTLSISYVFALTVTPAISALTLRANRRRAERPRPLVDGIAQLSVRQPAAVLVGIVLLVGGTLALVPRLALEFFPQSDRNQVIVDVSLPEGAHIDETDAAARAVESFLAAREDVRSVASFVGRGVPHFYYNLVQKPARPHLAQLVVTTRTGSDTAAVIADLRHFGHEQLPGVEVIGRRIEQGPPVNAPIEVILYGDDLSELRDAAARVSALLRTVPGAVDVRHDLSMGVPTLRFDVYDPAAARLGLGRDDVALALLAQTRGLEIGTLRDGDEPVPIVLRGVEGERTPTELLGSVRVSSPASPASVPVLQVAGERVEWAPAAIRHHDRRRVAHVHAQLDEGSSYSEVLSELRSRLSEASLPEGVSLRYGGDAEASGESNAALLAGLPVGVLLLLVFLMGEFNSFRKVAIVLLTVPLAAVGVVPGLVFGGQPFGFMSMLGVFALVGIVVNNAIVLIDLIGSETARGADVSAAIAAAVRERTRPILLTTATTVAGLVPLAVSSSTMWPPLALSMISGLLASTLLTLLAVPAAYRILHRG